MGIIQRIQFAIAKRQIERENRLHAELVKRVNQQTKK